MKKGIKGIIVGFVVLITGTLFFFTGVCQAQEKHLMRFSHGLPEDHSIAKQYKEWGGLINQRSKGALSVEIFPSATLFKPLELIRAIQMGTIESGGAWPFDLAKSIPEFYIFSVPFTYYTTDHVVRILNSDIRTILGKCAERQGIEILSYTLYPADAFGITSKKPLRIPSDCKGKVFRATDRITASFIKFWGGGAAFLSGGEVYMALQRGTIDGSISTTQTNVERKLYEVSPHLILLPMMYVSGVIAMNKDFFLKLSKELQQVVLDVSKEIENKSPQIAREMNARDLNYLKGKGLSLPYTPTQAEMALWEKGTQPLRDSAMGDFPGGKELLKKVDSILRKK